MVTCLVTLHGMGFQQLPEPSQHIEGYADTLHKRLNRYLNDRLGGDTDPRETRGPDDGPIYVSSHWPPEIEKVEPGLARLGQWELNQMKNRVINIEKASIIDRERPLAHIALVYSQLKDTRLHLGATLDTVARVLFSSRHYLTLAETAQVIFRLGLEGLEDLLKAPGTTDHEDKTSLKVRSDLPSVTRENRTTFETVMQHLEQDVATYVCHNELRERVRSFVYEALLRLCYRPDVEKVVVNAHSQGTVLAFDVLRQLPPAAVDKVTCFVTAGSPLRKYVDLFYWGQDAGCISNMKWINFWDENDPVADPLAPEKEWKRGQAIAVSGSEETHFYFAYDADSGKKLRVGLKDIRVDNLGQKVGGGFPVHNYWDNEKEFVEPLARLLEQVAGH
ncbi:MAG TPA: hypothetical protein VH186_13165 [Chloroflexia bacterium]|nr:hypothetical protein [Chloroflexia bacterium]